VTELDLEGNKLHSFSPEFVKSLINNPVLTSLNLSVNGIKSEGATALSQVLQRNRVLSSLSLYGNDIKDTGATSIMMYVVSSFPTLHTTMKGS